MQELASILGQIVAAEELPLLLKNILAGLTDPQLPSALGTCVALNGLIKVRGEELKDRVPEGESCSLLYLLLSQLLMKKHLKKCDDSAAAAHRGDEEDHRRTELKRHPACSAQPRPASPSACHERAALCACASSSSSYQVVPGSFLLSFLLLLLLTQHTPLGDRQGQQPGDGSSEPSAADAQLWSSLRREGPRQGKEAQSKATRSVSDGSPRRDYANRRDGDGGGGALCPHSGLPPPACWHLRPPARGHRSHNRRPQCLPHLC